MKRPPSNALEMAAEWLDCYDDDDTDEDGTERDQCRAVAEWLRHQAALAFNQGMLTSVVAELAEKHKVSRADMRRVLRAREKLLKDAVKRQHV
jgi:hypothetical protein